MKTAYFLISVLFAVLGVVLGGAALYLLMILIVEMFSGDPLRLKWQAITLPLMLVASWLLFKGFRDLWMKARLGPRAG